MAATRAKVPVIPIITSKEEADKKIARLGQLQRQVKAIDLRADRQYQKITDAATSSKSEILPEITSIVKELATYGEYNRKELTKDEKTKTVKLPSGSFSWRFTPPSVSLKNVKELLARLKQLELTRFIRTKEEVDKEALLKEPKVAEAIEGVTITRREEFVVTPNESGQEVVTKLPARKDLV